MDPANKCMPEITDEENLSRPNSEFVTQLLHFSYLNARNAMPAVAFLDAFHCICAHQNDMGDIMQGVLTTLGPPSTEQQESLLLLKLGR